MRINILVKTTAMVEQIDYVGIILLNLMKDFRLHAYLKHYVEGDVIIGCMKKILVKKLHIK